MSSERANTEDKIIVRHVTPMADRILTVDQFIEEASISRPYFYQLVKARKIRIVKLGRMTRINGREFLRWRDAL